MSLYELQKLIRDVNCIPSAREQFFKQDRIFIDGYELTERESDAVANRDYGTLYAAGVHGLILRPFSLLHGVSETDYLKLLREVCDLRADPQTGEPISCR